MPAVLLERLPHGADLALPTYATAGSAGADLVSAEGVVIEAGARALIACGFRIAVPAGFEAQVRPRSGLAYKHGVTVLNAPGTIDSDYRGEVKVLLVNHGAGPFAVERGDRIAQLVISPVFQARFEEGALDDTARGAGGFGSTGVRG